MRSIAIITARGGSKRIPRKNIKEFMGKPMIAYAIEAAAHANIFDEIMVSTDDDEIADISKKFGAKVPFMRSEKTANDYATTADVLGEVICNYIKLGKKFGSFCCIYPCVPFLNGDILCSASKKFDAANCDTLIPVVKYSHPIQRALELDTAGFAKYREPEFSRTRTQDLSPTFHDAGMFYFSKTEEFLNTKSLITQKTMLYEMDERRIQDIDTLEDWNIAEMKYKMMHNV